MALTLNLLLTKSLNTKPFTLTALFSSQTLPGKVGESTLTPDADTDADVVPPPTPGGVGVFKNGRALDGSTLFENFVSFLEETVAQTLSK